MKVNVITENECFNMDSETGRVDRNLNIKWNLMSRVFYIDQDGALKLPEDSDYVVNFDTNDLKAGDFIFVSYRIAGKIHIIRLRDESLTKLINILKEECNKQKEGVEAVESISKAYSDTCSDTCSDECRDTGNC